MNIVNKVTLQHMKQNRKKTLVTLLGIILSVALITAISSFAESFLDMMRRDVIAADGEWHVLFSGYPKDQLDELAADDQVKGILMSRSLGCAYLEDSLNPDKVYLGIRAYNDLAMSEYPLELREGRFPENSQEIVLPAHLAENGGVTWKVGDVLTLELGKRVLVWTDEAGNETGTQVMGDTDAYYWVEEGRSDHEELRDTQSRTFTVVGIVERPTFEAIYSGSYSAFTFLDEALMEETDMLNAAVQLRNLTDELYDWGKRVAGETGAVESYHASLLSYYLLSSRASAVTMLDSLRILLIAIVMLGSVAVIYSSFAISVSERSKYLGMIASVGATKRQKSQSVFYEGFLLGLVGIPAGLLVGILGTLGTMQFINPVLARAFADYSNTGEAMTMRLVVSGPALAGAVLAAAVTIAISAWIPARRASRISPIEAIRQSQDVKLTKRQVRVSPVTRFLFGFPGELALKNLKRNKKRYRATVLSLVLCIALFLSVSAFSIYLSDAYLFSMGYGTGDAVPDLMVSLVPELSEEVQAELDGLEGITQKAVHVGQTLNVQTAPEALSEEARQALSNIGWIRTDGQANLLAQFVMLDEATFADAAEEAGVSLDEWIEDGTHPVLLENTFRHDDGEKITVAPVVSKAVGETMTFSLEGYAEEAETVLRVNLRLAGLLEKSPYGETLQDNFWEVRIYMTREVFDAVREEAAVGGMPNSLLYMDAEDPLGVYEELEKLQEKYPEQISYVYSAAAEKQQMDQLLLLMNIFIYSFIILTSLICVTSIFNTISTGMALRRREYAMLESVGMDRRQFHRMIRYESIFYGLKALLYGLPVGGGLMWLINRVIAQSIDRGFYILWKPIGVAVICVLGIVSLTMWYSMNQIEKANIVDALKEENV